ncbi:hypothetical protein ACTNDN_17650 [Niallia sp. HCP3S3_B10]|uniref:hypothetical protein n=1 Tax=Niallia sp. HCP3S3_B10 TaxID=3438944 RepID=UPI003F8B4D7F
MDNEYISYLNSLNNANSSNENALAEAQVTNPFYEKIRVERNLGGYLAKKLKEKPISIILTGHAGDGKTSLVYQILRQFELIKVNEDLKIHDEIYSEELSKSLFYVKDMSELSEDEQNKLLKKSLNMKGEGNSSILVSNTGPLLNTFKRIYNSDKVEMKLLELMDNNDGTETEVAGNEILLINMARIDNVILAPKIFNNLLEEDLWEPCQECQNSTKCPVYSNYKTLSGNIENVNHVISAFYRWMFENDRRLTVRQILSHLSFSITGNLSCSDIDGNGLPDYTFEDKFRYNSSNLFFGYIGINNNDDANQIKAIRELQELKLDSKELENDYSFFVKHDFSFLTDEAREIAQPIWEKYNRHYTYSSLNLLTEKDPYELRKALRRMQILFGKYDEESISSLFSSLFSPVFSDFLHFRNKKIGMRETRVLRNKITKTLYFLFVGSFNGYNVSDVIYLPLVRLGSGFQNVQLLQGKIEKREIKLSQEPKYSNFDMDENHFTLEIKFAKINETFSISLMLLDYLDKISKGAVSTKINPSLSHGIDTMKSRIYETYRYDDTDIITTEVLVHTNVGPKVISIEVDNNEMYVE